MNAKTKKNKFITLTAVILLLQLILLIPYSSAEKIVLVGSTSLDAYYARYCIMAYKEAFKRLGCTFDAQTFPSKRCGMLANNGQVDGLMTRSINYNKDYPSLLRVNYIIFQHRFLAFTTDPTLKLEGWNSLADTNLQVTYRRGSAKPTSKLPKLVSSDNLQTVTSQYQGFFMLIHGRSDLYVEVEASVISLLKKSGKGHFFLPYAQPNDTLGKHTGFYPSQIYIAGVLQTVNAYPFLHKKHQKLALKLPDVLHKMEKEGLLEKYKAEAMIQSNENNGRK